MDGCQKDKKRDSLHLNNQQNSYGRILGWLIYNGWSLKRDKVKISGYNGQEI